MAEPNTITGVLNHMADNVIQELIGNTAIEIGRTLDPVFADMIVTGFGKAGDTAAGDFTPGRDLLIKRRYHKGMTGEIVDGSAKSHFTLVGDTVNSFGNASVSAPWQNIAGASQVFPDGRNSNTQGAFGMSFTLYSILCALPIPLELLRLDANPANIQNRLEPHLRGFGRNIANYFTNAFYVDSAQDYRLGTLPAAQSDITINVAAKTIKFVPTEGTSFRFAIGMMVDIYSSGGTRLNIRDSGTATNDDHRVLVSVRAVDPMTDEVTLVAHPSNVDVSGQTATFAGGESSSAGDSDGWAAYADGFAHEDLAGAYVRYATGGSTRAGLYSWRDWTKWGSANADQTYDYLLGDRAITATVNDFINVLEHPEFRSFHKDLSGASLTETTMVQILSRVDRAMRMYGHSWDTMIASPFIAEDLMVQQLHKGQIQRAPGTPVSIAGMGVDMANQFEFVRDGQVKRFKTSDYMDAGSMLIIKIRDNWQLVTPNEPNAVEQGNVDGNLGQFPISFVGKYLGYPGNVIPTLNGSGQHQAMTHMPGYIHAQYAPKNQTAACYIEGVATRKTDISLS